MGSCRRLKYVCHTFYQVNSTNKKNGGKRPLTFPWASVFYFDFVFNVFSFSKVGIAKVSRDVRQLKVFQEFSPTENNGLLKTKHTASSS